MKNTLFKRATALSLLIASAFAAMPSYAQTYTLRVPATGIRALDASAPSAGDTTPVAPVVPAAHWTVTNAASAAFADTNIGTTASSSLTLKNTGTASGSLTTASPTGANAADFAAYPSCTNVAVNSTCVVGISFTPSVDGARTANLALGDASVTLSGKGLGTLGDAYYPNVILQMHFDGVAGSSAMVSQKGPTPTGTAKIAGGTYAYVGSGSMALVPSDTVSFAGSTSTRLNTDYTIEYWFLPTAQPSGTAQLVFKQPAGYPAYGTTLSPSGANSIQLEVWFGNAVNASTAGLSHPKFVVPVGTWFHFVQETIGAEKRVYINGKKLFAGAGGQADGNGGGTVVIATGLQGYMDELRITKGVGRYDADFTPSRTVSPNQ